MNDRKSLTDLGDIAENVSVEKNGRTFFLQRADQVFYEYTSERIEATHRLIEKDDLRLMEDGLSEGEALKHSFRVFPHTSIDGAEEIHLLQRGLDSLSNIRFFHTTQLPTERQKLSRCEGF